MLSHPIVVGLLLLFGRLGMLGASVVSDHSQVTMRRHQGMLPTDPALMDTMDHPAFTGRMPPPEAIDADIEEVRRVAIERSQSGEDKLAQFSQSSDDDDNRRKAKPDDADDDDSKADYGTQGYVDPRKVARGPDPNRAVASKSVGGTSMLGTSSQSSSIEDGHAAERSDKLDDPEELPQGSDDPDLPTSQLQHNHDDKEELADLPDETDRPTNEVLMATGKLSPAEKNHVWLHDADAERARMNPSGASLIQIEQINPRIVHAVRKAMREEIRGFKGYLNSALGLDSTASLLEEGATSQAQRQDPAGNMYDRVSDILDSKPSSTEISVPGRMTPAELAQDRANTQKSAMKEAELAMKEMDDSTNIDFSKGAMKPSDLDDTEGLLIPRNGASISSATTGNGASPTFVGSISSKVLGSGASPTSMSQTADASLTKTLSVQEILNGGASKVNDEATSGNDGSKDTDKDPDGETLLQAQEGSVSAMKKLALALKRKTTHTGADSLLDKNDTSTKKADQKSTDLFSDIMSETGASDALPAPKPTTLKEADVFAAPSGNKDETGLFASLGQTEAGVDMKPDERSLFADLDKPQDNQDQKERDVVDAFNKAPAQQDKSDDSIFADLGKLPGVAPASMQGSDSLLDSLSKSKTSPSSDSILDSLNQPSLQPSSTGPVQSSDALDSLSKDGQAPAKTSDLSTLLKELKA